MHFKYLIVFLFFSISYSQSSLQQQDFSKVDSISRTIKYNGDLKLLVSGLTNNYSSEPEKARAIFVWIADNIAYDVKTFNKHKSEAFKCKGDNCKEKYIKWEDKLIERTLSKKMAVCGGYSRLFKRMCDYAGLRTDLVSGYTKNDPSDIGRMGSLNHAWNGIMLNGEYYYLDVTWAAGGVSKNNNGKLERFHKDFSNYYWLTPTDKFFRDHFPHDIKLPHVMVDSKQKYMNTPYIHQAHIKDITVHSPDTGILNVKVGDTIHFVIQHKDILWSSVQLNSNIDPAPQLRKWSGDSWYLDYDLFEKHKDTAFTMSNYIYEFHYVVTNKNLRHLDVYFDHHHMLRFKVKIIKEPVVISTIP